MILLLENSTYIIMVRRGRGGTPRLEVGGSCGDDRIFMEIIESRNGTSGSSDHRSASGFSFAILRLSPDRYRIRGFNARANSPISWTSFSYRWFSRVLE